ncbi:MAG: hypothetical protein P8J14_04965 [Emcibacteraceae bacterium]|nr:hypothetical protein [Emcibacteraceae bacterium]
MFKTIIINKTTLMLCGSMILLSGCSTIDGFLGGGLNDPANTEVATDPNSNDSEVANDEMEETSSPAIVSITPVDTFQTTDEMLNEKDQALISQGMRLAVAEKELIKIQEEKNMLQVELDAAKKRGR